MKITTKRINTNVITGFLGVGKTTLIQQLLANKPADERWAVLVNEFGQIGIDASLMGNDVGNELLIKQVPGGCLCCAAGLPTQVAMNQLIQQAKPDRILIEPTGLGHPKEIINTLQSEFFAPVLRLDSVMTLIDARKVTQPQYATNDIFVQQAKVADTIIVAKSECYQDSEQQALLTWLDEIDAQPSQLLNVSPILQDASQISALMAQLVKPSLFSVKHPPKSPATLLQQKQPTLFKRGSELVPTALDSFDWQGNWVQYFSHSQQPYTSHGWIFSLEVSFGFDRFMAWVETIRLDNVVLRLKAVVITYDGILGVNVSDDQMQLTELDDALDSRVELICQQPLDKDKVQQGLLACVGGH